MEYNELIQKYGSPLQAGIALGFCKTTSGMKLKKRAGARVCNWARNGIPAKIQAKLIKMHQDEAASTYPQPGL